MNRIVKKEILNSTVTSMEILAPAVAKKARAGQFVILRVDEMGERIPLTVAGCDREAGTVRIIFQIVGASTMLLNTKVPGEFIEDFVGPLGKPTCTRGMRRVLVVGGGVGCAIALPIAEELYRQGCTVDTVVGFRRAELVILKKEFETVSSSFTLMTDDGSTGRKGLVTERVREILEESKNYDCVFAIGPLVMMKFVVSTVKPFGVPVTVSMNPIMIDGTGMCGCCRLTVGGELKFACVDGPDFDGYLVDFDEAISRSEQYLCEEARAREKERAREETCNLLKMEVH